jgi:hypothetical protein
MLIDLYTRVDLKNNYIDKFVSALRELRRSVPLGNSPIFEDRTHIPLRDHLECDKHVYSDDNAFVDNICLLNMSVDIINNMRQADVSDDVLMCIVMIAWYIFPRSIDEIRKLTNTRHIKYYFDVVTFETRMDIYMCGMTFDKFCANPIDKKKKTPNECVHDVCAKNMAEIFICEIHILAMVVDPGSLADENLEYYLREYLFLLK